MCKSVQTCHQMGKPNPVPSTKNERHAEDLAKKREVAPAGGYLPFLPEQLWRGPSLILSLTYFRRRRSDA